MRTSFNIPNDLVEEFDETWEDEGLDSRSRGIREAMQEYIEAHAHLEDLDGEIVAVVGFDYVHEPVIETLHSTQHEFQDVITTTNHAHEGEWCLETLFCHGPADRIRQMVYELRDFDEVNRVKLMLLRSMK